MDSELATLNAMHANVLFPAPFGAKLSNKEVTMKTGFLAIGADLAF